MLMDLPKDVYQNHVDETGRTRFWDTASIHEMLTRSGSDQTLRSTERLLEKSSFLPRPLKLDELRDEQGRAPLRLVCEQFEAEAKRKRMLSLVIQLHQTDEAGLMLFANDGRLGRRWVYLDSTEPSGDVLLQGLEVLAGGKALMVWPHGEVTRRCRELVSRAKTHQLELPGGNPLRIATFAHQAIQASMSYDSIIPKTQPGEGLSHLDRLEAESIHIMREVMAQAENPVMLYSVGKDSSVMLHLAKKAFHPAAPPFPLLHVDTTWKFREMYEFRDRVVAESGMELIVHVNQEGVDQGIGPFSHGSSVHTDVMKTQSLKQALDKYRFDVAFGGARRDEEKSRAKERIFSFRDSHHQWDPKNQRPELWKVYNAKIKKGENVRVFPLSNWTELDVWLYIWLEDIPVVPLYFAKERPVVERSGTWILVDDDRMRLEPGEKPQMKKVRFRTLGCYPLSGAVESEADTVPKVIQEMLLNRFSERQGRLIDFDEEGSMEEKKREGYF